MSYQTPTIELEMDLAKVTDQVIEASVRLIKAKMERDRNEALCARDGHVDLASGSEFEGLFCTRCGTVLDRERFDRVTGRPQS